MKTLLAICITLVFATVARGQGTLYVGNRLPFTSRPSVAPIYGPDPTQPTLSLSGQSSIGTPTGTVDYGGPLLEGPGWTFAAFAGPLDAPESQLALLTAIGFQVTPPGGQPSGIVSVHTSRTVPGVPQGQFAKYQIRVWDNLGGSVTSWEQAQAAWEAGRIALGQSAPMISSALGGFGTNGLVYLPPPTRFLSFNIAFIPEPTSIALLGLGIGVSLVLRGRK